MRDPKLDEPCARGHIGHRAPNRNGRVYCTECGRENARARNLGHCWTGRKQSPEHIAKRMANDSMSRPKHGHRPSSGYSPTYLSWHSMKQRVRDRRRYYTHVTVDPRWLGDDGFANFLADMGERPIRTTLDRIDGNLGYTKENCRWADTQTQLANRRTRAEILATEQTHA